MGKEGFKYDVFLSHASEDIAESCEVDEA